MNGEVIATVHEWHSEEGWGRVTVDGSGIDVWTHYSVIEGRSFALLHVGEQVRLWFRPGPEPDEFQASRVVPIEDYQPGALEPPPSSDSYGSNLIVTDDPDCGREQS